MQRIRKVLYVLGLVLLLVGLFPAAMQAGAETDSASSTDPLVVRLYFESRDHLNAVAGELDIWEVNLEAGYAVAAVSADQRAWLEGLGYRLELDEEKTAQLSIQAALDPRFYYYDDFVFNGYNRYLVEFLQEWNSTYSNLVQLYDIGDAWLAGQAGEYHRDIWVLRITNEDPTYGPILAKPAFFLLGGIHAREVAIPELVIRYIKYLTSGYRGEGGYGVDPDVTWLVNHNVLYALVMLNPDGHAQNEQDINNYRRKNMDWDDGCNNPIQWGVDLNRNHSFFWGCCGGSSGDPCSETYRGPSAASEPETQAFQAYFAAVMEDQNGPNGDDELPPAAPITTTGVFITLHSYSDVVIWPYGFDPGGAPNHEQMRSIARKLAYYNGYDPSGSLYTVDGSTDDWTYGKFGIPSFTFEVGPGGGDCGGFFPAYGCLDGAEGYERDFWQENKPSFIYAHKIARTPYMTALGPDTADVRATPAVVPSGSWVQLAATVADQRLPDDPVRAIAGAEYFVDAPGEDGTGTPLTPVDGDWGNLTETVRVIIDAGSLSLGNHYLLVHGQNDQGDWGPLSAVFVRVVGGACEPVEIAAVLTETTGCDVTFSAELTGTAFFQYGWDFGPFGRSDQAEPTVSYPDSGTYTYTLALTNCGGTDDYSDTFWLDCCEAVQGTSWAGEPAAPLAGQVVTFTAAASGTPPIDFHWDMGDGHLVSGTLVTHTYVQGGSYTVTLSATNACGQEVFAGGLDVCGPVSNLALHYAPPAPIFNHVVMFTASVSGTAPFSYSWDMGDGTTDGGGTVSHVYTRPGSYTLQLTVTNCAGAAVTGVTRTVAVGAFRIYLPVVLKQWSH